MEIQHFLFIICLLVIYVFFFLTMCAENILLFIQMEFFNLIILLNNILIMSSSAIGAFCLSFLFINNLDCHLFKIKSNIIMVQINHLIQFCHQQLPRSLMLSFLQMRGKKKT